MTLRLLPFLLSMLLLATGCIDLDPFSCDVPIGPVAPSGFTVSQNGTIDEDRMIRNLQMLDQNNGFAMDDGRFFVTTDGGTNWATQPIPFPDATDGFAFTDPATGWFPRRKDDGACLMKTVDGGQTFTEHHYPNIERDFLKVVADNGDLFAVVAGIPILEGGGGGSVARSVNDGETFETLFTLPSNNLNDLVVRGDRVYVAGISRLWAFTRSGEPISVNNPPNYDFDGELYPIDDNDLLYAGNERLERSTDGGLTWTLLHDGNAKILGGDGNTTGILLLLQTGECEELDSVPLPVSALAVLRETLEIGPDMLELEADPFWEAEFVGEGRWFLTQYRSNFWEISVR